MQRMSDEARINFNKKIEEFEEKSKTQMNFLTAQVTRVLYQIENPNDIGRSFECKINLAKSFVNLVFRYKKG